MFEQIAKTFESAAPKITELLEERAREEERRRKEFEETQKRWRLEEEERRCKEQEAACGKHIQQELASWRMARDVRAYVAKIHALVKDADLKITEGAGAAQELKWALAYADQIDPLTSCRKDIEKVKAEAAGKPCQNCGKVHDTGDDAATALDASADVREPIDPPGGRPIEQEQNAADSGSVVT